MPARKWTLVQCSLQKKNPVLVDFLMTAQQRTQLISAGTPDPEKLEPHKHVILGPDIFCHLRQHVQIIIQHSGQAAQSPYTLWTHNMIVYCKPRTGSQKHPQQLCLLHLPKGPMHTSLIYSAWNYPAIYSRLATVLHAEHPDVCVVQSLARKAQLYEKESDFYKEYYSPESMARS